MSQTYNFTVGQGEDWDLALNMKDDSNQMLDLTGYSYSGQIRDAYDSSIVIAVFSFEIANQILQKGRVTAYLTHEQTSNIPLPASTGTQKRPTKEYMYDIVEIDALGKVTRILEGSVIVTAGITK